MVTNVDIAKLKRLRAAVSSALERVPEQSAHGLPPTYNSLREQVAAAVPQGLLEELVLDDLVLNAGLAEPGLTLSSRGLMTVRRHMRGWLR